MKNIMRLLTSITTHTDIYNQCSVPLRAEYRSLKFTGFIGATVLKCNIA